MAGTQMAPQFQNLIPGANNTGSTAARPYIDTASGGSIGDRQNPLVPRYPSGQTMPGPSNAYSFPANGGPVPNAAMVPAQPGSYLNQPNAYGSGTYGDYLQTGLEQSGLRGGVASALANFLATGSGYSPQVVKNLIAALQPQIARGEANLMEQFGSAGLGRSSAAAIGMGDYLSQVTLDEGQLISNLYEQSVNNYMNVLMGIAGIGEQYQSTKMQTGGTVMGDITGMISALSEMYKAYKGSGGSQGQGGGN